MTVHEGRVLLCLTLMIRHPGMDIKMCAFRARELMPTLVDEFTEAFTKGESYEEKNKENQESQKNHKTQKRVSNGKKV